MKEKVEFFLFSKLNTNLNYLTRAVGYSLHADSLLKARKKEKNMKELLV